MNGGRSSVGLEHQIVVLKVAGSNPVVHPNYFYFNTFFILLKASIIFSFDDA